MSRVAALIVTCSNFVEPPAALPATAGGRGIVAKPLGIEPRYKMTMQPNRTTALFLALLIGMAAACGDDDADVPAGSTAATGGGPQGGAPPIDELAVSGTVVDFADGAAISSSATISVNGLNPPPTISVTGAEFEISGIAPHSVFQILAGAPPDYRNTYGDAVEVTDADVTGVQARVVSEAFLTQLVTAFGVTPAAGTGIVIGRTVDANGAPQSGVQGSAFQINDTTTPGTPYFLDDAMQPDVMLTATSASGYVVFYDVPPGLASFGAAPGNNITISSANAAVAATAVTLAELSVSSGELMLPTNVSFAMDVVPIFDKRGCTNCHSGNSIGADLGDLALNSGDNKVYKELTEELSPTHMVLRVDLMTPEQSLVLTMPSFENPADRHPNVTFPSASDADYLTLLGWITEGAKEN